jgi:hypothetical protein
MKKIIILCIMSTFVSTHLFSMLTKFQKRIIINNLKTKKFSDKNPFDYEAIILQKTSENLRLKAENHSLKQQLKNSLTQEDMIELNHMQEQINFVGIDRRGKLDEE